MTDPAARFGDLAGLLPLTGIWRVESEIVSGETSFAWSPGRKFLVQVFDFRLDGRWLDGIEFIGLTGGEITGHACFFRDGRTEDSIWRLDGGELIVRRGAETAVTARLDADGRRWAGVWIGPGGGHDFQAFKIDQP